MPKLSSTPGPAPSSDRRAFLDAIGAAPGDEAPKKVFADWLDDLGEHEEANRYRNWKPDARLPELEGYDWDQAFGYADETAYHADTRGHVSKAAPHLNVSEAKFSVGDVVEVIGLREGEGDGPNWVCVGRLYDGRWFAVDAGCDYTGWD